MDNLPAYAKLDDAALRYIIRDAGAAAIAMRTHGTPQGDAAEAKYLDQVNDATTILARRAAKPARKPKQPKDWQCNECGHRMTLAAATRAFSDLVGCRKCGGADIEMAVLD